MTPTDRPSWALVAFDQWAAVILTGSEDVIHAFVERDLHPYDVLTKGTGKPGGDGSDGLWIWEGKVRFTHRHHPFNDAWEFEGTWRRAKVADLIPLAEDGAEVLGAVAAMAPSAVDLEEMEKDVVMWDTLLTEDPEDIDLVDNLVCASREAEQGKKLAELFKKIGGQR